MFTLQDLHDLMTGLCDGDIEKDLYFVKHMKRLLQERYGQSIVFAEIGGRKNVVRFRNLCRTCNEVVMGSIPSRATIK